LPSLADVLAGYYGSEGFPAYPDPQAGGLRPADVLAAIQPPVNLRDPAGAWLSGFKPVQPAGGAFGTLTPQEEAVVPATTAKAVSNFPATMGNVLVGTAESLGEDIKRMTEASARQEFDPAATFRTELNIAGMGMPFAAKGAAGIFGGRLGAERLAAAGKPEALENLAKAEAMLAAGATRDAIHSATGWHQNQIGQWLFEIPDIGAGFRPQAAEHILPQITGGGVKELPQGGAAYEMATVSRPGQQAFAEHAFAHPDLYAAYPELRQLLMRFEDPMPETNWLTIGGLDPINRDLYLNPAAFEESLARQSGRKPGIAGMRSTTLHELQHGVQQLEGFPRGGGPGYKEVQQAADQEIKQNVKQWEEQLAALHARRDAWIDDLKARGSTDSTQELAARFFAAYPEATQDSIKLHTNIYNANRGIGRQELLAKHYRRLAGEVEARNVQYRADMTPEMLAVNPPWMTQETPYGEQLIRMGDPALGMQAELPSFPERMQAGKDVEFARAQRGGATGNYGLPIGGYKTPAAPKGSFEDLAARTRAGFKGDKERIIDEYRTATGQPPKGDVAPLLAPGETAEDVSKYFNLEFMPGESAGPIGGVGMPYLGGKAPLFDYRRLSDVPDVPQFNLPRFEPPEGVPERFTRLAAPGNVARVNAAVQAGEQMGGREWYNTEQLRQEFVSQLGDTEGNRRFRRYMELVAATSPRTKVPENIRNASYYYGALERGDPIPEQYLSGGYWRIDPRTQAPSPYGIMPIHVQNMENIMREGLPVLQNPKPASFVENLTGNQLPVTIDVHNMRLWSPRGGETAGPGYGFLERLQQEQAQRLGMTPAQYQASAWLGGGKQTGLASPVEPFLRTLEDRIRLTAEARGLTPGEVLRSFIRGQHPLL
jgi:hypothetical protein